MSDTSSFVKIKSEITEPERTKTYGSAGANSRPVFDPGQGIITLLGLPGSGRRKLAELLAGRLDMQVCVPVAEAGALLEALSPVRVSSPEMDAVGEEVRAESGPGGRGKILVLGAEHLALRLTGEYASKSVASLLKSKSKVFWLMAEPVKLARVNNIPSAEAEAWTIQAVRSEELFHGALHFILQADKNDEELLRNVMYNIGY